MTNFKVFVIYILIQIIFFNFSVFELEKGVRNSLKNNNVVVWQQSNHKKIIFVSMIFISREKFNISREKFNDNEFFL